MGIEVKFKCLLYKIYDRMVTAFRGEMCEFRATVGELHDPRRERNLKLLKYFPYGFCVLKKCAKLRLFC